MIIERRLSFVELSGRGSLPYASPGNGFLHGAAEGKSTGINLLSPTTYSSELSYLVALGDDAKAGPHKNTWRNVPEIKVPEKDKDNKEVYDTYNAIIRKLKKRYSEDIKEGQVKQSKDKTLTLSEDQGALGLIQKEWEGRTTRTGTAIVYKSEITVYLLSPKGVLKIYHYEKDGSGRTLKYSSDIFKPQKDQLEYSHQEK